MEEYEQYQTALSECLLFRNFSTEEMMECIANADPVLTCSNKTLTMPQHLKDIYNLYLREGYDASATYPMVVFIGDSSCEGSNATVSLTQGRGALVWRAEEWQSVNPTVAAVLTYPETILDDHGSSIPQRSM